MTNNLPIASAESAAASMRQVPAYNHACLPTYRLIGQYLHAGIGMLDSCVAICMLEACRLDRDKYCTLTSSKACTLNSFTLHDASALACMDAAHSAKLGLTVRLGEQAPRLVCL